MWTNQLSGGLHWGGHRKDAGSRRTQIPQARPMEGVSLPVFLGSPGNRGRRENSREEAPRTAGVRVSNRKAFVSLRDTPHVGPLTRGAALHFPPKHILCSHVSVPTESRGPGAGTAGFWWSLRPAVSLQRSERVSSVPSVSSGRSPAGPGPHGLVSTITTS